MKKLLCIVALAISFIQLKASHIAGGEIFYEYVGDSTGIPNQYVINLILYRDFSGVSLGNTATVNISSTCFGQQNHTLNRVTPAGSWPLSDGGTDIYARNCVATNNVALIRFSRHFYTKTVVLPGKCADFTFSYTLCCRTNLITNIMAPNGSYVYIEAKLNNTARQNSSIKFNDPAPLWSCIGTTPTYQFHGGVEKDGDSIHYSLATPKDGPITLLQYPQGYSAQQPISTVNGVTLNSQTGMLSYMPTQTENDLIVIKASEFRYDTTLNVWLPIGETMREYILNIVHSCIPQSQAENVLLLDSTGIDQRSTIDCFDSIVKLKLTQTILSDSVSTDGSEIILRDQRGNIIPVSKVTTLPQNSGNLGTKELRVYTQYRFIYHDTLSIQIKTGNDGNSWITECGTTVKDTTFHLIVDSCLDYFDLQEIATKISSTHAYPNPVSADFVLMNRQWTENTNVVIEIFDLSGTRVKTLKMETDETRQLKVESHELPPGVYHIHINVQNKTSEMLKLIKN